MGQVRFDKAAFALVIDAVRAARKLQWKEVAVQAGVSASTLTRIQQGKAPDADTLTQLIHWAGVDFNKFVADEAAGGGRTIR